MALNFFIFIKTSFKSDCENQKSSPPEEMGRIFSPISDKLRITFSFDKIKLCVFEEFKSCF